MSRIASLCLAALALGSVSIGQSPSQKEISRELAGFLSEHFADQNGLSEAEFKQRHAVREARVLEIVRTGALATLDDWDHAAVILQYSDDAETILLAHALVVRPAVEDVSQARTLVAFALDHYLANLGKRELFGIYSARPTPADVLAVEEDGTPLPDSIRKLFRQSPLAERAKKKVKKPGAKELAALRASSAEEARAALPRVRELVASGLVEKGADLAALARLLCASPDEKDLLVAHVVALCAGFEEHPEGTALALEALDRYLLATKRGQLFGTVRDADGKPAEPCRLAPEVVLRGYGLLAAEAR